MAVDVASGTVSLTFSDIFIPGRFPLVWKRRYSSKLLDVQEAPMGRGWAGAFFCTLTRIGKDWQFTTPEGGLVTLSDPEDKVDYGKPIRDPGTYHEIGKFGFYLKVTHWDPVTHEVIRYVFQPARYGQLWPLRSIETLSGYGLDLAWDDRGLLKGVRQRIEKRTLVVSHTPHGKIATVGFLHADGRQQMLLRHQYDAAGSLIAVTNALNQTDRYEYDSNGRIKRELAKDGGIFSFKYDDKGRCNRAWGLDDYDLKIIRYFDSVRRSEVVNSYGHVTRYALLPTGQVASEMNPMGGETSYEYDAFGRLIKKTDAMGASTAYAYDESGNRDSTLDGLGNESKYVFNADHQAIAHTDACGGEWKKVFDGAGRLVSTLDPVGAEWKFEYDRNGAPAKVINPLGPTLEFAWGPTGDIQEIKNWDGFTWKYRCDEFGRITEIQSPAGKTTLSTFDLLGNLIAYQSSPSEKFTFQYNAKGQRIASTDAKGRVHKRIYGPCGRLAEKASPRGTLMRYVWGTEPGLLLKMIDPKGKAYEFRYDGNGRKIREKGFDGRVTHFKRNPAGDCIATGEDPNHLIRFELDANARIVAKILPDGDEVKYAYDAMGRMLAAENPDRKLEFARDPAGRVTKEIQGEHVLEFEYDVTGNLIGCTVDKEMKTDYRYGVTGSLEEATLNARHAIGFQRGGPTDPVVRNLPGGLSLSHRLGSGGNALIQKLERGGAVQFTKEFHYNEDGKLETASDSRTGKIRYSYNHLGLLAGAQHPDGFQERIGYDDAGGIVGVDGIDGPEAFQVDDEGRLLAKGGSGYEYDGGGRLVRILKSGAQDSPAWDLKWNALDQLASVTTPDGETWNYAYDALGRRFSKQGPKGEFRYVWNRHVMVRALKEGKTDSNWLYPPSGFIPLGKELGGKFHSIVANNMGTPVEMRDSEGETSWSATYGLFGREKSRTDGQVECEVRFQGQWFDPETGFHYNRFRYYDPGSGRYISQDPIGLRGGLNPYAYGGDPLNWADPFGLVMVFRGMKKDAEGKPVVYSGPSGNGQNAADSLGHRPDEGGMSSNTDTAEIQDHRKPESFGGNKSDEKTSMFVLDTDQLAEKGLVHDPDHDTHVSIKVAPGEDPSTLAEKLASTKELWKPVTPEEAAKIMEEEAKKKGGCSG